VNSSNLSDSDGGRRTFSEHPSSRGAASLRRTWRSRRSYWSPEWVRACVVVMAFTFLGWIGRLHDSVGDDREDFKDE